MLKRLVFLVTFLLVCFSVQSQILATDGRVLDTWTVSWTETVYPGPEVLFRESKHVTLYLDQDILRVGDDRYEIIRDLGPTQDIRGVLNLRFEALDRHIQRVRLVFRTGDFVNQIQVIYADRVYKYNLEQYW